MKILHYSLGIPPYRSGGLTKYSVDLMKEQTRQADEVYLLYPGKIGVIHKKDKIVPNKKLDNIHIYELINPMPVPLLEGIIDINAYTQEKNKEIYKKFLEAINPDVIHIHTWMGLPKEFIEEAKKKHIRIIYTTHDYFGLCPKVSLYNMKNEICKGYCNEACSKCCQNALSSKKILLLQSHLYKVGKDTKAIKLLRKQQKAKISKDKQELVNTCKATIDYAPLKNYYNNLFAMVDIFHFNSQMTMETFYSHIKIKAGKVIPITHEQIEDKRIKKRTRVPIQFAYLGAQSQEKGYYFLKQILDKIPNKEKWKLNLYFQPNQTEDYMCIKEPYSYAQIETVFEDMDVLIVPSLWKETFGFVVLEALAHGTPVILSENVGASYLVKQNKTGYIFSNGKELEKKLEEIIENPSKIEEWNQNILEEKNLIFNIEEHAKQIKALYEDAEKGGEKDCRK